MTALLNDRETQVYSRYHHWWAKLSGEGEGEGEVEVRMLQPLPPAH